MFARVASLVLILAYVHRVFSFDSRNIVFAIVSQRDPYEASVATKLKQILEKQVLQIEGRSPIVHTTHEDFPIPGAWTIIPLLRPLLGKYKGSDVRWVVFLEPHTVVRCDKLIKTLASADQEEDTMWIGYPLADDEPTIIHHFAIFEELEEEGGFVYPNFASGFAMRLQLMETLLNQILSGEKTIEEKFSIDPSFELARLIYGEADDPGPLLADDLVFCLVKGDNCATYPKPFDTCRCALGPTRREGRKNLTIDNCHQGRPAPEHSIFFAVKTWSGYHSTRAKIVKRTWGQHVTNLMFYSDEDDPTLPALNPGIPNTKKGHCVKTMTILKMAVERLKSMPHVQWIFLADDDTILGVQRLTELLSCYTGGSSFTVIGERYGYGFGRKEAAGKVGKGYDYITLGGGAAFSIGAATALSRCTCGSNSAPDDMTVGECTRWLNETVTHSPLFHQNRPQDYPREVLARDRPVSFHRHSSPDPLKVYATWFQHDDLAIKRRRRDEL